MQIKNEIEKFKNRALTIGLMLLWPFLLLWDVFESYPWHQVKKDYQDFTHVLKTGSYDREI